MLIVGAKGFAKEVLEILHQLKNLKNVAFFDNISDGLPDKLFEQFPVLKSFEQVKKYFLYTDPKFTLGLGEPILRYQLFRKMEELGGELSSSISPFANIGHFGNVLSEGCNIMTGTVITNDVQIKRGCLINLNCTIGHDCEIGEFVEMSPGVHVSGNCKIGRFSNLGTNATILPKVELGENVIVGAGAVVTKNVESNSVVVGIPAKKIKVLSGLEIN